jgi:hypothetical protein
MDTAMIDKAWKEEVARGVDGLGLPWRVSAAWVDKNGPMVYAELTDTRNGKECRVSLSTDRFPTPADRRVEIARQLSAPGKR